MIKIVFKVNGNCINAYKLIKDTPKEDLNKTNVIDTKELVFSDVYIKNNLELVSSFLNVIIIKRKINTVCIRDFELITVILDIINTIPNITNLIIKPDESINYDIFLKLLDNNYLENLEVYDFPRILLDRLDTNKKIVVKTRTEILFVSNFMKVNNLNTYSDIYYKKNIVISDFTSDDKNDIVTFIKINKYLKEINFKNFSVSAFDFMMNLLIQNAKEDIKISFEYDNLKDTDINVISKYKKVNERLLLNANITFKINYSEEYRRNNLFKQININFIKVSLGAVILVIIFMIGINYYKNYVDEQHYLGIENNLKEIIKVNQKKTEEENPLDVIEPGDEDLTTTTTTTTTVYDIQYEKVFSTLQEINKDTVGWLTVNNTRIDYPVVQAKDNDYYLRRDYYQNKNRHGWIFMDYRNNPDELNENTIIYGHNLANQTMFGTLRYALNSYWYKKSANQIITFNTPNENMKFQIFSIYTIPTTNDYLDITFPTTDAYQAYIDLVKGRSIYDFNIEVATDDKILTLSTCANGNDKRLVIHAKLIKES
ncbi:MAG: SrtB family sortase [Clostridiaceae bacterium]|nr:MAG: SrtB family sortase [Clostridiaceae bacterium]